MQPWLTVYFLDIGHPCFEQLTPVKTRYLLTSIMWPYRGLKSTTHRGHMFFFEVDRWPSGGFSIGSRAHVRLTCWKQSRIVRKPANANPGLKLIPVITFSSIHVFFAALFCVYKTQNRKPHRKVSEFKSSYLFLGYLNQVLNNLTKELRF